MNSLICIIFASVLLSQVTCNTLARMKLHKEAGNNEVRIAIRNSKYIQYECMLNTIKTRYVHNCDEPCK